MAFSRPTCLSGVRILGPEQFLGSALCLAMRLTWSRLERGAWREALGGGAGVFGHLRGEPGLEVGQGARAAD